MPIISQIGRKSLKTRLVYASIYALLSIGAVSMIYPFLLMIAGTTKSAVDSPDANILPPFLISEKELYKKHIEGFFNENLLLMQSVYNLTTPSFRHVEPPSTVNIKFISEWEDFAASSPNLPEYTYGLSYSGVMASRSVIPKHLREFKQICSKMFKNDIVSFNNEMGTEFIDWNNFWLSIEFYTARTSKPPENNFIKEFWKFKQSKPVHEKHFFSIEGYFKHAFLYTQYSRDIAKYNELHNTNYDSYDEVHLHQNITDSSNLTELERRDWEIFVREILNPYWIRVNSSASPKYREFLKAKYISIQNLNKAYSENFQDFDNIIIPEKRPSGLQGSDWEAFLQGWKDPETGILHILPKEALQIESVEFNFRDHLKNKYSNIENLNRALGSSFKSFLSILPPQREFHYHYFKKNIPSLRKEFLFRNFISVIDFLILHGKAVRNTIIYCTMAVLCALIFNPLAAYALSRYKPPTTYKMLLFLMLTMAFPPMVTQIPIFLMLREFNLLNTFWALILPGLANGYSIFLLKGFFDSLPKELYESAELDGAGEFRIFWQFTMALSTPILAVIALNAFTFAYSNFMMALLICQDENMWTLMPWLYQFQRRSSEGVIYASLIIAAIPTFLIFVFCQKIIMKGIVVPTEK